MDPVDRELALRILEMLMHDPELMRLKNELYARERTCAMLKDPLRYAYAKLWWLIDVAQDPS